MNGVSINFCSHFYVHASYRVVNTRRWRLNNTKLLVTKKNEIQPIIFVVEWFPVLCVSRSRHYQHLVVLRCDNAMA